MSARWLDDPGLRRVWDVLRERLEARGLRVQGRVVLGDLDREERHAVAGLLGRSVTRARVTVDLAALDADLAARSGVGGLVALRGAELRYHGDFDWAGIAIANRLIAEAGVTPWRMSAADYERGLAGATLPLVGAPVEPAWDPELGAAMPHHRVAVHEEAVLPDLLDGST